MNYNNLFEQEAFKTLDKNTLEEFKELTENIKGKDTNTTILHIMDFYKRNSGKNGLSEEQTKILIDTIVIHLNAKEREQFLGMLDLIVNMV